MQEEQETQHLPVVQEGYRAPTSSDDISSLPTLVHPRVLVQEREASAVADLPTLPRQVQVPPTMQVKRRWRGVSTLVALGIFVVVNVVVQVYRRPLEVQGDGFWALRRVQACESLGRTPHVIYLGSSRAVFSTAPHVIDDLLQTNNGLQVLGCNASTFSSTFEQDYYVLKRMLEDGYTPKAMVENLWEYAIDLTTPGGDVAHNISGADTRPINISQLMNLADVTDVSDLQLPFAHAPAAESMTEFLARKLIPVYGTRYGIIRTLCGNNTLGPCSVPIPGLSDASPQRYRSADDLGWVAAHDATIADLMPSQKKNHRQYYHHFDLGVVNFRIGGHQGAYLNRLIELAQAHHIRVALVTSPVHPYLLDYLSHPSDWQIIINYWQSIADAHHISFYDQSRAKGYGDADFIDPNHLSAAGAIKFSTWMAHAVMPSLLT